MNSMLLPLFIRALRAALAFEFVDFVGLFSVSGCDSCALVAASTVVAPQLQRASNLMVAVGCAELRRRAMSDRCLIDASI